MNSHSSGWWSKGRATNGRHRGETTGTEALLAGVGSYGRAGRGGSPTTGQKYRGGGTMRDDNSPPRPRQTQSMPHIALKPHWTCRGCGFPWPCGTARLDLIDQHRDQPDRLIEVYLTGQYSLAVRDLYALNRHDFVGADALYARFVGWATRGPQT